MKILLTGGGTAGHVMPNLALLPELKKTFSEICYAGSNGMEKDLVRSVLPFFEIPAVKLRRGFRLENLAIPQKLFHAISESKKLLRREQPDVVFSKGGYVGLPLVIAAKKLGIPAVIHESDLSLGLANRIGAHYARWVCTTFPETARKLKKGVCTGTPVRRELESGNKSRALSEYGFSGTKPVLLVTGGSQGAEFLNRLVRDNLDSLTETYDVLHLCGKGHLSGIRHSGYAEREFCNKMADAYAVADFVISRAGSNTVNEIVFLRKPALLVPLPKGASRGDQMENAAYFESRGLALVLYQEEKAEFSERLAELQARKNALIEQLRRTGAADADKKICRILTDCARSAK